VGSVRGLGKTELGTQEVNRGSIKGTKTIENGEIGESEPGEQGIRLRVLVGGAEVIVVGDEGARKEVFQVVRGMATAERAGEVNGVTSGNREKVTFPVDHQWQS
jgi:hypothetical protein